MNTLVMVELYKGRLGENLSCWRRYTSWLRSDTATHCLVSALTLYVCVSHPAVSNFLRPHGLQPTRLLCPWDFPGKSTGVGYYCQFSSVAQSCLTLCHPMNHSTSGLPVHHQLPEVTQTHAHRVGDAIQPSHLLSSPSPPASNPSQHQGLFQWVNSSHQVVKVLEFQLQHQSFQWTPRTDLL